MHIHVRGLSLLFVGWFVLIFFAPMPPAVAVSGPMFQSATFFGGAGDQRGSAVRIRSSELYIAGYNALPTITQGLVVKYNLPPGTPVWSSVRPDYFYYNSLALPGSTVMLVGGAVPPTCGATDGVGGTEGKSGLARFDSAGNPLGCSSTNFFIYTGGEGHSDALDVVEGASTFVYAAGNAENCGFGHNLFVLTKYDDAGNRLNAVTEPGVNFNAFNCVGYSNGLGLSELGGFIYVAGYSGLAGLGEDGGVGTGLARPVLMKYDSGLNRIWKARAMDSAGFFRAVTSLGGNLYAVGNTYVPAAGFAFDPNPAPGSADYLIEKYDAAGNRSWRMTSGGAGDDVLTGVVAVGSRLFAVGYTRSSGAGGADAVILEIDPATGATVSTTLYGGSQDDSANGVATDGLDLYVVGESRSFASGEGNAVGQNDAMLLRYSLNQPPVALCQDVTVSAGPDCTANASIDNGSFDPDSGDTITVTQSPPGPYPIGQTTVMLTIEDSNGASSSCQAVVTVLYNFSGFFQPVDNTPTVNMVNAGSAIPVKFSLSGNKGLNIFAAGYPVSQKVACASGAVVAPVEETITAGNSSLSYDATTDTYTYVWKTDKAWKGTCRQLILKLSDSSTHVASFQFK